MQHTLTDSPVDLIGISALGLDGSTTYVVQPVSTFGELVHIDDGAAEPAANAGLRVQDLEIVSARAGTGGKLWAWAPTKSPGATTVLNIYAES